MGGMSDRRITGLLRDGDEIALDFHDYTESVLPADQQARGGCLTIASGWIGGPIYWNHKGQYLDGKDSPHEYDLVKVDGCDAFEYLYSRCITRDEIDEWLKY